MSKPIELHELNKSFGVVRNGIDGRCEPPDAVQALEQIAIQFNLWRNERAAMLECIAELVGALRTVSHALRDGGIHYGEHQDGNLRQKAEVGFSALTRAALGGKNE